MQTNKQTDFANQGDTISRQAVINLLKQMRKDGDMVPWEGKDVFARIRKLPSAQPDMAENLYPYKCYITDEDGLQHEVIHTGDIRRVTGWEI